MLLFHFDKTGERRLADLSNLYADQALFIVGGSPSLTFQDTQYLLDSPIMSMGLNNVPVKVRTQLWCGGDHPACYAPGILAEPRTMKFASLPHAEATVQGKQYFQYPNTFFYVPETEVPWHKFFDVQPNVPWYHNTLFSSIHIAYMLGFRRIYLAGCDFNIPNKEDAYIHATALSDDELDWNRRLYAYQVEELRGLRNVFDQAGLELIDTSVFSKLADTYKHMRLDDVIRKETEVMHPNKAIAFDTLRLPHSSRFVGKTIGDIIESRLTPENRGSRAITVI